MTKGGFGVKSTNCLYARLIVLSLFAMCIPSLLGQSGSTSAVTGRITDPTGAVLPGVSVTVTSIATNQTRTVLSAEDGVYRVPLLDPGSYRIRFSAPGFKTKEIMSVTLAVTDTVALDQTLEVGATSEEITVEAIAETIQTATSTIGTTVSGNTISSLPLPSRNFTSVLGMAPGVAVDVANGVSFGKGSLNMSVNGANPEKNNFQMDGVAINNAAGNNMAIDSGLYTGIAIPNPDAIQEFKIQTSTYDSSYGRNPGANVNVVTKSGSNEFHGSLFEFFRNEHLNANDFFYNRSEEHTSELQSPYDLVCRLLLEKKNIKRDSLVADDTEAAVLHRYRAAVLLAHIFSLDGGNAIIVTLALHYLPPLAHVLSDKYVQ